MMRVTARRLVVLAVALAVLVLFAERLSDAGTTNNDAADARDAESTRARDPDPVAEASISEAYAHPHLAYRPPIRRHYVSWSRSSASQTSLKLGPLSQTSLTSKL